MSLRGTVIRVVLRDLAEEDSWSGHDITSYADDLTTIGDIADEIGRALDEGLDWLRKPWPDVVHDERGIAVANQPRLGA